MADPFNDAVPEDRGQLRRGAYHFLKVATTTFDHRGVTVPVNPDSDAFEFTDVRRIEDPDGNDITASWVTNVLDPSDPTDVYNAAHPDYVGTQAAPENVGLFFDGTNKIAQKVFVPSGTEITIGSSRAFKIVWGIRVGGNKITASDGELYELFDVADSGALVFDGTTVTVGDVRDLYSTPETDPALQAIINKAHQFLSSFANRFFEFDIATNGCLNDYNNAVLNEVFRLLTRKEITNSRAASSMSQGGMSLSLPDALARIDDYTTDRDNLFVAFLTCNGVEVGGIDDIFKAINPRADVMRNDYPPDNVSNQFIGGPPI